MQFPALIDAIETSRPQDNWIGVSRGTTSIRFYSADVNLRIECSFDGDDIQGHDFKAPWANKHPDPKATGYFYNIYYGSTLLKRVLLVSVDGGRADLPVPETGSNRVGAFDYKIAEIVDSVGTLGDYMKRSGLTV
jgi:hypothetical protein